MNSNSRIDKTWFPNTKIKTRLQNISSKASAPENSISILTEVSSENNKKNSFVLAAATAVPATVGSIIGAITNATNTSDSSMQNRLANATVGFINSTVSESTAWSTAAVVGAVSLGALAILSGVGGICCYLSKKTESYNNSLVSSRIIRN